LAPAWAGKEYREILGFAKSDRVDLIVLGRHGHSGLEEALFGSVSEKVIRKADCPVLIVPMSFGNRPPR